MFGFDPEPEMSASRRAELDKMVDCKAVARKWVKNRSNGGRSIYADWTAVVERAGFDPEKSITEIDDKDYGDADGWYDTAQVHALRYLPLKYITESDLGLLTIYDAEATPVLPIAVELLKANPLAGSFEGELLSSTATIVGGIQEKSGDRNSARTQLIADSLLEIFADAYAIIFTRMRQFADQKSLDADIFIEGFKADTVRIESTEFKDFALIFRDIQEAEKGLFPDKTLFARLIGWALQ